MSEPETLDVSVVLPTYNEAASLPVLVPRIVETLEHAGLRGEVIVVDDDSPDGTVEVARKLAEQLPVRVLHRTRDRGLARAVIAGFAESRAQVCAVMDADGSHPVDVLPEMVRMVLSDRAEIAVGSRHVPGGGSEDWPLFSQLKSRFAASLALGLSGLSDPTTGFMAVRRTRVQELELDPVGWKIVLETVVKAHPARVAELPIVFTDRELGESKQTLAVLMQYLLHLYKLYKFRFPALIELLKFCIVGGLGVFVDLAVVIALKQLAGLDTRLCQLGGFTLAVSFNYLLNRYWSFERARETPWALSYFTYVAANLVGLTVRMLVVTGMMAATQLDQGHGYLLLSLIGIALATAVNFVGVKYLAFDPERLAFERPPAGAQHRTPASPVPPSAAPRGAAWVLGAAALLSAWLAVGQQRIDTRDEAVNVTMARNIARSGPLHPSTAPGVPEDWRREALPQLGNTPVYPSALAVADSLAGVRGMGALAWAAWLLAALGLFGALWQTDRTSAWVATLAWTASPNLLDDFALLEFEPWVTALGILAFAAAGRAVQRGAWIWGAFSGALLGGAFAVKMWLATAPALACLGLWTFARYAPAEPQARRAAPFAAFAIAGTVTGGAHLLYVAALRPEEVGPWLQWVYLALFSGRGVTGAKLAAAGTLAEEARSHWAYPLWFVREHAPLCAVLLAGMPALTRRLDGPRQRWLAALAGAFIALVLLSIPAVKEPLYLLPAAPFFYGVAGLALVSLARAPAKARNVHRSATTSALLLAPALAALLAVRTQVTTGSVAWAAVVATLAWCGPALAWKRQGDVLRASVVAAAIALVATFAQRTVQRDVPHTPTPTQTALREHLVPHLGRCLEGHPCFAAREPAPLSLASWKQGRALRPGESEIDQRVHAYVLDATARRDPELKRLRSLLRQRWRQVAIDCASACGEAEIYVRD